MLALQAGVVAAPRPVARLAMLERLQSRAWALVPIASIVIVVFAIRYVSDTATGLTYLALVAVPLLAAAALGWAARGAKPIAALAAIPLFAIAWADSKALAGRSGGRDPLRPQLRDARGAAARRDAGRLAEGGDRADGGGGHLAGHLRPAPGAERDAHRSRTQSPACRSSRARSSAPSRWATAICSSPACSGPCSPATRVVSEPARC